MKDLHSHLREAAARCTPRRQPCSRTIRRARTFSWIQTTRPRVHPPSKSLVAAIDVAPITPWSRKRARSLSKSLWTIVSVGTIRPMSVLPNPAHGSDLMRVKIWLSSEWIARPWARLRKWSIKSRSPARPSCLRVATVRVPQLSGQRISRSLSQVVYQTCSSREAPSLPHRRKRKSLQAARAVSSRMYEAISRSSRAWLRGALPNSKSWSGSKRIDGTAWAC